MPLLIGFLASSSNNIETQDGFIETNKVFDKFQDMGYVPEQIEYAIIRGVNKKLIETTARQVPEKENLLPRALRSTTSGIYHINRLTNEFSYIDAIIVDTPVLDYEFKVNIHDVTTIQQRIDRVKIFCSYMDENWRLLAVNDSFFDWNKVSSAVKNSINHIERKIQHNKNNNM